MSCCLNYLEIDLSKLCLKQRKKGFLKEEDQNTQGENNDIIPAKVGEGFLLFEIFFENYVFFDFWSGDRHSRALKGHLEYKKK